MSLANLKKMSKGMSFNLDKEGDHLRHLRVILTWDGSAYEGKQFDADLTVALLEDIGVRDDGYPHRNIFAEDEANLVFYRSDNRYFMDTTPRTKTDYDESQKPANRSRPINICSANEEVIHTGDNRDGSGEGEVAEIFLDRMAPDVSEIAIVGTIHKGRQRRQNWGELNGRLALQNIDTGETLAEIELGKKLPNDTAVHFASIFRDENGEWQFTSLEAGSDLGLEFFIEQWTS